MNRVELGEAGFTYLVKTLSEGASLARLLAERIRNRRGQVFTDVSAEIPFETAMRFNSPLGIWDDSSSQMRLAGFVANQVSKFKSPFIAEDDLSQKSDPWLSNQLDYYSCASDILWILETDSARDTDHVRDFLSRCYSHRLIGVVSPHPSSPRSPGSELAVKELGEIADQASLIVVSAYDDTGYIYWTRTD